MKRPWLFMYQKIIIRNYQTLHKNYYHNQTLYKNLKILAKHELISIFGKRVAAVANIPGLYILGISGIKILIMVRTNNLAKQNILQEEFFRIRQLTLGIGNRETLGRFGSWSMFLDVGEKILANVDGDNILATKYINVLSLFFCFDR